MQLDLKPINHPSYWPMIGFRRHVRAALILARAQWSWMWGFIVSDGQRALCGVWHAAKRDGCVRWLLYPSVRVRIRHLIFHGSAVEHHPLLREVCACLCSTELSSSYQRKFVIVLYITPYRCLHRRKITKIFLEVLEYINAKLIVGSVKKVLLYFRWCRSAR